MANGHRVLKLPSPETRNYWNYWNSLKLKRGLLFKEFYRQDGSASHMQFIVPKSIREEIFKAMHNSRISGHLGRKKTTEKLLQRFFWYNLREDVNIWIRKCDICAANQKPVKTPKAPLGDMLVGAPLDRICTDILGPLPITSEGNQYILVVTDSFSKWTEAYAIPDQTAVTSAKVILNEFICRYGCPLDLHSDQGRNYTSNLFKELCKLLEVRKTQSSPRHPQGNGQVERFNRTLIKMLKSYTKDDTDWDQFLGCLTAAYRATPHESTGLTPNMLMLGREVRLPMEVIHGYTESRNKSHGEHVDYIRERLYKAHEIARKHLKEAAQRQKDYYDIKTHLNTYCPGDMVWYLSEIRKEGVSPKLQHTYVGPYLVLTNLNNIDYLLQLDSKGKQRVVHHNKLKPYEGNKSLKWAKKALNNFKKDKSK